MKLVITDVDTGDEVAQADIAIGEEVTVDTGRGIWNMELKDDADTEIVRFDGHTVVKGPKSFRGETRD